VNFRERNEEQRRRKMEDIETRVADGSLTIRKMTDAERKRFGIGDPDRPHRRFFFPGSRPGTRRADDLYGAAARAVHKETGVRPTSRRIYRVDCELEGKPCRLEVGEHADACGAVVTAIFELKGAGELVVSSADDIVALRVPAAGADMLDFA
jgi:hypothetical protein